MPFTPRRTGELCIVSSALLWSLFPVVTILTYSLLTPLYSAALSTLLAAVFFGVLVTVRRQWRLVFERRAWRGILLTSLFIGVLFYAFIFLGLRHTTAGNESIMALMEVFFSFLILGFLLRHEPILRQSALGGSLMVIGALLILLPKSSLWHSGDLLILIATIFAPLGNREAQEARKWVSAEFIMFCRSILSGVFLLALALFLEPQPRMAALISSLGFLVANGIVLLGFSKILWIEGIHRIPITEAISLESITPVFTLIVAAVVLHEPIGLIQIAALVPIAGGILLLTMKNPKTELR